jgi:excisionase family DNA binding protein
VAEEMEWLGTKDASARLGITLRSLYRFIDEGDLPAYKFGRVIRVKVEDIDRFIESCRIEPGQLEHLYPPLKGPEGAEADGGGFADSGAHREAPRDDEIEVTNQ